MYLMIMAGLVPALLLAQNGSKPKPPKPETIYEIEQLDAQPMYPGGPAAFYDFLERYITLPPDSLAKYDGNLQLSFIVYSNGQVNAVRLDNGKVRFKDMETSIFNNMPKWKPGTKNGKAVSCRYTVTPHFKK
jgi:hypothetical protein